MLIRCGGNIDIGRHQQTHLIGADFDMLVCAICHTKQNDKPFVWDDLDATAIVDIS